MWVSRMLEVYKSDIYTISLIKKDLNVVIGMQINNPFLSTGHYPNTFEFLKVELPSVLTTKCYNDKNLPFSIEVKNTELGHLFEHILLEKLCLRKLSSGRKEATFAGRTEWDWIKNPYGYFQIKVELRRSDFRFLRSALFETISLFNNLIAQKGTTASLNSPTDSTSTNS